MSGLDVFVTNGITEGPRSGHTSIHERCKKGNADDPLHKGRWLLIIRWARWVTFGDVGGVHTDTRDVILLYFWHAL